MREELAKLLQSHNSRENGIMLTVPIEDYVTKIIHYATIVPYWIGGELKAFIAYYNNDKSKSLAFLTMILIDKDLQGKGLGKLLLEFSMGDLQKNGFKSYGLEVLKDNEKAIQLYTKLGFIKKESREQLWYMEKSLT